MEQTNSDRTLHKEVQRVGKVQTVARKLKKTFNYRLRNQDSSCKKKRKMLMYSVEDKIIS